MKWLKEALSNKMISTPLLKTQRYFLCEMSPQDVSVLQEILDDDVTRLNLPELGQVGAQQLLDFFTFYRGIDEGIFWAIRSMDDNLVGFVAFMDVLTHPTLFFAMHPDYRGQGIMKETIKEIIQYASTIICGTLYSEVMPANVISQHILMTMGFRLNDINKPMASRLTFEIELHP